MKIFDMTFSLFFISFSLNASELLLKTSTKTIKIKIEKFKDIDASENCSKEKENCLKALNFPVQKIQKEKDTLGNPASDFCQEKGGASLILEDQQHNEYDYCLLQNKYYIDSWNYLKAYKK